MKKLWVLLLGLFAIASLVYSMLWNDAPYVEIDTDGYVHTARDLRGDFQLDRLQDRPPGYPLLLLATGATQDPGGTEGDPPKLLFYVQLLLHFGSISLLALLLHRFRFRPIVILGFATVALLPPFIEDVALVLSETTAQFFLVVGTFTLITGALNERVQWLWGSGFAFAYSALVRPAYLAVSIAIVGALALLRYGKQIASNLRRAVIALLIPAILFVGAYSLLNLAAFNYFGVTPLTGFHLSTKTARFTEQMSDKYADLREVMVRHRDRELVKPGSSHTARIFIFDARPELLTVSKGNYAALSKRLVAANVSLIAANPLAYLEAVASALGTFWLPSVGTISTFGTNLIHLAWAGLELILIGAFFFFLVVVGGSGLVRALSRRHEPDVGHLVNAGQAVAYVVSAAVVVYTWFISASVDVGNSRHRSPVMLLLLFCVVLGARILHRLLKREIQPASPSPPSA